ncbi:MAG: alpha/beta hydrolase [Candidatus Heimdallarchaeota archaeon]
MCYSAFMIDDVKEGILERIEGTNIYFKTYKALKGLRDTYNFCKNNPLMPKNPSANIMKHKNLVYTDPLNSKIQYFKVDGSDLLLSEFESPDAPPQPYFGERMDVEHGSIYEFTSRSEKLNNNRRVLVYTPPNYSKNMSPYHFLLLFDGISFEEIGKVSSTIDNLIADEKIPPLIAVMTENFLYTDINKRSLELAPNPEFMNYIINELLPWIRKNYNVTSKPSQSVIAGASLGGISASYIAFKNPEIFGNVLSMSGAFAWFPGLEYWFQRVKDLEEFEPWWSKEDEKEEEWLVRRFSQTRKLPLKFYITVGILEQNDSNQLFISNRHFRNVLTTKGYPISYVEFLGGHDLICWRGSIADGLIYLIGK